MKSRHRRRWYLMVRTAALSLLAMAATSVTRPAELSAWPAGYAGPQLAESGVSHNSIVPAAWQVSEDADTLPDLLSGPVQPQDTRSGEVFRQEPNAEAAAVPETRLSEASSPFGDVNAAFSETDFQVNGQFDFNHFPEDFLSGAVIRNGPLAVKIGGYVKADLIYDFDPIDSGDLFDPAQIPVDAPPRTDARFHARQTRLNLDTRWIPVDSAPVRVMVEGDFFGDDSSFRLRHAYGERGGWLIGQTWSTLAHRAALPNTLDVVGDVASVGRRQAQLRWTLPVTDELHFAAALEDSNVQVEEQFQDFGDPRTPSPDFIARLRYKTDGSQFQLAGIVRQLGFQPTGMSVRTFSGSGLNATGVLDLTEDDRAYGGILWGTGIGNYRDLPDLAPTSPTDGKSLESMAWYVGLKHQWSPGWASNFTFSSGDVENTSFQPLDSLSNTKYLAANLIWQPGKYGFVGAEYLWGYRQNRDALDSAASRVMMSVGFILP